MSPFLHNQLSLYCALYLNLDNRKHTSHTKNVLNYAHLTIYVHVSINICNCLLDYRGILPALGHDRVASEGEILGALAVAPAQQRMHITHLFNVSSFHHRYELYSTPLTVYVYIQMLGYLCHNCCIYLMSNVKST